MDNLENNNIPEIDPENVAEVVEKTKNWKKELLSWGITIGVALIIAFILKTFFLTFANVSGPSMLPTLRDGDMLYVNKFMYEPEKGDVVIVDIKPILDKNDPNYNYKIKRRYHVKRIIATEGDSLYIDGVTGDVYVNDKIIDEPYINNQTTWGSYLVKLAQNGEFSRENPLVLGENEVFVMGDNRQNSEDSRINGPYTEDMIVGHALFRIWPLKDFGGFEKD